MSCRVDMTRPMNTFNLEVNRFQPDTTKPVNMFKVILILIAKPKWQNPSNQATKNNNNKNIYGASYIQSLTSGQPKSSVCPVWSPIRTQ
jgi:hypothetical protein